MLASGENAGKADVLFKRAACFFSVARWSRSIRYR
jgi:hypothetical protein